MLRAFPGAFAVNGLRASGDNFSNRQIFLANNFEHLRGAERIDMHVFGDLGHVAAVGSLMKDDVDLVERSRNHVAIAQIGVNKFRLFVYPRRSSAAMRLRFKIIETAHFPALAHQQIGNMRADKARAAGHKCAFCHAFLVAQASRLWPLNFASWSVVRHLRRPDAAAAFTHDDLR